ncbi:MAG: fibronectin type III domain-containing protein [Bacteroidia bacterium]|nr:fibronectin type III domain-containing protein [Bacteroidia bacterium]
MKLIHKYIVLFLVSIVWAGSGLAQEPPKVLSFFDGSAVHVRWQGIPSKDITGYRIYRDDNGKWKKVQDTKRLVNNGQIKKTVGAKSDLFLKLAGARSAESDFTDKLYEELIANEEAYQFFGALTVLNVEMAEAMGEYVKLDAKSFSGTLKLKLVYLTGRDETEIAVFSVPLASSQTISPPANTTATAQNGSVTLRWDAYSSNDPSIVGFYVYRSPRLLGPFNRVNSTGIVFEAIGEENEDDVYVDDYLNNGTYYYYVTYYSVFGLESEPSEVIKVTLTEDSELDPVINLQASGELGVTHLTWDSTINKQAFEVARSTDRFGDYTTVYPPSSRLEFNDFSYYDRTAEEGQLYYYFVRTFNTRDTFTTDTISFMLADNTPPNPPTGVKGTVSKEGAVSITWNKNPESDILGYEIERFTGDSGTNNFLLTSKPLAITSFSENLGRKSQSAYRYVVYAIDNSYNRSKGSEPIRLRRPDDIPPRTPGITYVMLTDSVVRLRWTPNLEDDFKEYSVFRKTGNGALIKHKTLSTNSLTDTLSQAGDYTYSVSSSDFDNNESAKSESHTLSYVPEFSLISPTNGQAIDSSGGIFIRWTASKSANVSGYLIERKKKGSDLVQLVKEHTSGEMIYLDQHVKSSGSYTYFVTAYDKKWNVSAPLVIEYTPKSR